MEMYRIEDRSCYDEGKRVEKPYVIFIKLNIM